jgi:hypothetical protein
MLVGILIGFMIAMAAINSKQPIPPPPPPPPPLIEEIDPLETPDPLETL